MGIAYNPTVVSSNLLLYYDMSNTDQSWRGAPTTNFVQTVPYSLNVYAYVLGPVTVQQVPNESGQLTTVSRYTITSAINTARAAIYPSVSVGQSYIFSCKIKYNGTNVVTPGFVGDAQKGSPEGGANNNTITSSNTQTAIGNGWYLLNYTFNIITTPTNASTLTFGVTTGADTAYIGNTFDVYDVKLQFYSQDQPTAIVTRTNTQALLDLTNNNVITAANINYNTNQTFQFINTSVITVPMTNLRPTTQITQECWFNTTTNVSQVFIGSQYGTSSNNSYALFLNGANTWSAGVNVAGTLNFQNHTATVSTGVYYHFVHTYDGANQNMYINGELVRTWATTGAILYDTNNTLLAVGNDWNGAGYDTGATIGVQGFMPVVRIYNRALTRDEVVQNFTAQRARYGV